MLVISSCDLLSNQNLLSHQNTKLQLSQISSVKPSKEPYIFLRSDQEKISLTQFNRSSLALHLLDHISFPFLKKTDLPKKKSDFNIKVLSMCTSESSNQKVVKETYIFERKSKITFLNVIPQDVLLSPDDADFTCSFIFSIKNFNQNIDNYIVTQHPFIGSQEEWGLILHNKTVNKLNLLINLADTSGWTLVKKNDQTLDRYRLICHQLQDSISFKLKDFKTQFLSGHLFKDAAPKGIQHCRILSEKSDWIYGMTQLFKVNFDYIYFKNQKQVLDLNQISYSVVNKGNPFLTFTEDLLGFSHMKRDPSFEYRDKDLKDPYLFSTIKFSGLPHDFSYNKYQDVQVYVHSMCSHPLTDQVVENHYQFLLDKEFSVMSVIPEWFLDLTITIFDKDKDDLIRWRQSFGNFIKRLGNKKLQSKIDCEYKIRLETYDLKGQKQIQTFPKTQHTIFWSSASYGVSLNSQVWKHHLMWNRDDYHSLSDTTKARFHFDSMYITLRDILRERGGQFHLLFLNQLANESSLSFYPDKMSLKCGHSSKVSHKGFQLNFVDLELLGSAIPLSVVFSHPSFVEYIKTHQIIVCRLLFYQHDILKYFSSELFIQF